MKYVKLCFAILFISVALAVAVGGIWLGLENRNAMPVLVQPSRDALNTASVMLQAVADGDYALAESLILGQPNLGVDRQADGEVGRLLWQLYQSSLEFSPLGECFATGSGIAQCYRVRYLDLDSVTATLRGRSQALLEQRVAEAEDVSEVYDENQEYREDVVMEVLLQATRDAAREDATYVEAEFTVNLIYSDGKWWVVSDSQLLSAISGNLVG
jgi:hypothetical protein